MGISSDKLMNLTRKGLKGETESLEQKNDIRTTYVKAKLKFDHTTKRHMRILELVLENQTYRFLWDSDIQIP